MSPGLRWGRSGFPSPGILRKKTGSLLLCCSLKNLMNQMNLKILKILHILPEIMQALLPALLQLLFFSFFFPPIWSFCSISPSLN